MVTFCFCYGEILVGKKIWLLEIFLKSKIISKFLNQKDFLAQITQICIGVVVPIQK